MSRHDEDEGGWGTDDDEMKLTGERRQFNKEELKDFEDSLAILGEDELVKAVIKKFSKIDNTEEASRILRDLEKQLVEVLDTDEGKAVEILADFVGDTDDGDDVSEDSE
jgi:hypothetical protein